MNREQAEQIARNYFDPGWITDCAIDAIMEAVAIEREECAKVADEISYGPYELAGHEVGAAIRARGER